MRPRVIVNCAMSADGKIASRLRRQVRLSDEADMARVHRLRNRCDAILVGVGTVLADDPSLLVKEGYVDAVSQPLRVVLDSRARTPPDARVLDGSADTVIFVTNGHECDMNNARVLACGGGPRVDVTEVLDRLHGMGVGTLLVEGGGETIWSFVKAGAVDEFKVFVSGKLIGGASAPTPVDGEGFAGEEEFTGLVLTRSTLSRSGILLEFEVG